MSLAGDKIILRFFEIADAESLLELHLRNSELFQKYAPTFGREYYTLEAKRSQIGNSQKQREEGISYSFGIFTKDSGKLVGELSLFNVQRGSLQKCLIGYSLDGKYGGRGYATEAVSLAVGYAFNELKLHRVEAGVMPGNTASIRVLEKAGFEREGLERKGVKINGRWEDHQIFARIAQDN